MGKVQVLLSTYNGTGFVAQQVESLLNQSYADCEILIRDDGSSDDTVKIIYKTLTNYPDKIRLIQGRNIGVVESFFNLLKNSDENADYFCFCDQDDIWLPDKIERAVNYLEGYCNQIPAMVFTATQMTDSNLRPITVWPGKPRKEPSFYNALVQNIAVGATITMNKAARDLICRQLPQADRIIMHDWWAYLCVSAFGKTFFDPEPSILYRQHSGNVVGGERNNLDMLIKKWKSFRRNKGKRLLYKQALEFQRLFGSHLEGEKKRQLDLFLAPRRSFIQRLIYLNRSKLYRQSTKEQLLLRFLILIGYI
ncbi:family 2 glycosyl transferase [Paenibacillus sp. 32O-W]|uniref:glycosyltransferase family 2 protein n=1 Tax=Paenibacillus sp. 32O-W TaxID=1695218 RepID=UPI00071F9598|nr:glycosyltransferase family 2 protein [Paenibacillus sp. 32O-W]ALS25946.1 family 2 glycosyl transferase [Paenibacillus sp. 32O-W]